MEKNSPWQHSLRRERQLHGWSQEDVAARIGSDPKTVGRWERGLALPGPHFQQRLVDLFGKDAGALGFIAEHGEEPVAVAWPPNLPDEPYYPLPGRERDLLTLLAVLQDPRGAAVITIDGLGGLGKTSLAAELTRRALHQELFEGVIGDSAKHELFAGGEIVRVSDATLDFDALLDSIARQRGRWEFTTLPHEEKRAMIAQLLRQQRFLVLVDNLETAENAGALVSSLRNLLGASRAIVTSRKQVLHDFVQAYALKELTPEDALFFLRKELEQRKVEQLVDATDEKLFAIYRVTGGAPLALKLVVAQARFLDLDVVVRRLSNAGSKLYSFIYRQSWEQLSLIAQKILMYISRTVVTTIGWEELAVVGMEIAASEEQLLASIDELVAYSLLEVSFAANQVRYGTHQLTCQFVNSELPELWREQGLL